MPCHLPFTICHTVLGSPRNELYLLLLLARLSSTRYRYTAEQSARVSDGCSLMPLAEHMGLPPDSALPKATRLRGSPVGVGPLFARTTGGGLWFAFRFGLSPRLVRFLGQARVISTPKFLVAAARYPLSAVRCELCGFKVKCYSEMKLI